MKMKAATDTACTITVERETWFENYMRNLYDTSINQMDISESHKIFKFEDGHKAIATSKSKLPAQISNTKCFVKAEIVKEMILLLLSKISLRKAGIVLNAKNVNIKIFHENVDIVCIEVSNPLKLSPPPPSFFAKLPIKSANCLSSPLSRQCPLYIVFFMNPPKNWIFQ